MVAAAVTGSEGGFCGVADFEQMVAAGEYCGFGPELVAAAEIEPEPGLRVEFDSSNFAPVAEQYHSTVNVAVFNCCCGCITEPTQRATNPTLIPNISNAPTTEEHKGAKTEK